MAVGTFINEIAVAQSDVNTALTTSSFTPTKDFLIVSWGTSSDITPSSPSISDTFSDTITWTQRVDGGTFNNATAQVWTGAGYVSGAGTITVEFGALQNRVVVFVDTTDGEDGTTPIPETASDNNILTTMDIALTDVPTGNRSYGAIISRKDDNGITVGANETELNEVATAAGGKRARFQSQYGDDGFDTSVNWSDLSTTQNIGCAMEVAADAVAADEEVLHRSKLIESLTRRHLVT